MNVLESLHNRYSGFRIKLSDINDFCASPRICVCFLTFRISVFFSALWSHSFPFSLKFRVEISRQVESNACRHCSIESGSLIVQTVQWCVCGGLWSSTASWNELPHATDPLRVWFLYPFFKVGKGPIDCEGWGQPIRSLFILLSITENSEIILRPETARQSAGWSNFQSQDRVSVIHVIRYRQRILCLSLVVMHSM